MVKDKVAEAEWTYFGVNEHWKQMKNVIMETEHVDPQAVAYSLRRLAYDPHGWLAGLSHGLGLLTA